MKTLTLESNVLGSMKFEKDEFHVAFTLGDTKLFFSPFRSREHLYDISTRLDQGNEYLQKVQERVGVVDAKLQQAYFEAQQAYSIFYDVGFIDRIRFDASMRRFLFDHYHVTYDVPLAQRATDTITDHVIFGSQLVDRDLFHSQTSELILRSNCIHASLDSIAYTYKELQHLRGKHPLLQFFSG